MASQAASQAPVVALHIDSFCCESLSVKGWPYQAVSRAPTDTAHGLGLFQFLRHASCALYTRPVRLVLSASCCYVKKELVMREIW